MNFSIYEVIIVGLLINKLQHLSKMSNTENEVAKIMFLNVPTANF